MTDILRAKLGAEEEEEEEEEEEKEESNWLAMFYDCLGGVAQ